MKTNKFKPFVFKIKTEQEAKIMWHRLNAANIFFEEYCRSAKIIYPDEVNTFVLWERFNKMHKEPKSNL